MRLSGRFFFKVVYVFLFSTPPLPPLLHMLGIVCRVFFFLLGYIFCCLWGFRSLGLGLQLLFFSFLCSYHYDVHGGQKEGGMG
jgi:hypothetical protein